MGFRLRDPRLPDGKPEFSFHLFQRVVGFRPLKATEAAEHVTQGFHLFQRVVGFRPLKATEAAEHVTQGFHLFQRVVGFRRV